MRKPMEFAQWAVGTLIAGIGVALGMAAFVNSTYYSRAEGADLDRRVERLETVLGHINDRLDKIYDRVKR